MAKKKPAPKIVNINLQLPVAIHRRLKLAAVADGITIPRMIAKVLDKGLPK